VLSFGLLGTVFIAGGISAKIITILSSFGINSSLSTGFIILGAVSFMMGMFASVVFRRQSFAEKNLTHYIENLNMQSQ